MPPSAAEKTEQRKLNLALIRAAEAGDAEALAIFLEKGASPAFHESAKGGMTALHQAVFHGHLECVRLLEPVSPVDARNAAKRTPLHVAAQRAAERTSEILRVLLNRADPSKTDEDGTTALMSAALGANRAAVEILLPVSDPNASSNGRAALFMACQNPEPSILKALFHASDLSMRDSQGKTPLMSLISDGQHRMTDIQKALILKDCLEFLDNNPNHKHPPLDAVDVFDMSVMSWAAGNRMIQCLALLIERVPNELNVDRERHPLRLAVDRRNWETADWLAVRSPRELGEWALSQAQAVAVPQSLPMFCASVEAEKIRAAMADGLAQKTAKAPVNGAFDPQEATASQEAAKKPAASRRI